MSYNNDMNDICSYFLNIHKNLPKHPDNKAHHYSVITPTGKFKWFEKVGLWN